MYSTLQCSTLYQSAAHFIILNHTTSQCSTLHNIAAHSITLHHTTSQCNTLHNSAAHYISVQQNTLNCCTLHHSAVQYITVQKTNCREYSHSRPFILTIVSGLTCPLTGIWTIGPLHSVHPTIHCVMYTIFCVL